MRWRRTMTAARPGTAGRRWRNFTLVELLAAMGIPVLLMALLFDFFLSAQKAWSLSDSNAMVYENAQVAIDLITRDLQSAVACNEAGREIPFHWWPTTGEEKLSFVTRVDTNAGAESDLCEVVYATIATGSYKHMLRRAIDCDRNSGGAVNTDWDFYGGTTNAWAATHGGLQRVIEGVESVSFACYHPGVMAAGNTYVVLPMAVQVSITLYDPRLEDSPAVIRDRTKRTFTKLIFLPGRS